MILSRLVRHSCSSYIKSSQVRLLGLPRRYCTEVEENTYLRLTNETLESISDKFNELIEDHEKLAGGDITLSDGVLTVKLSQFGIYVLNKQTPNKQIWLSSPVSGPYRYDISQVERAGRKGGLILTTVSLCRVSGCTNTQERLSTPCLIGSSPTS